MQGRPYPRGCARALDVTEPMDADRRGDDERALADDGADGGGEEPGVLEDEEQPLARVRYGLGKELRLFPDAFVVLLREERDELRFALANIERLTLAPGDHTPSKLVLMLDLDDGNTVIAAEGVTNVRDFRKLLARLTEVAPQIELDPPDMDEQLRQALEIRTRAQLGCYGAVLGTILLIWIIYLIVAFIGAQAQH
jgi:hypothetical protein